MTLGDKKLVLAPNPPCGIPATLRGPGHSLRAGVSDATEDPPAYHP